MSVAPFIGSHTACVESIDFNAVDRVLTHRGFKLTITEPPSNHCVMALNELSPALLNLGFCNFDHAELRLCHFVWQPDGPGEFNYLVVFAEAKGIAQPFKCANVADITLEVSCIPCA